MTYPLETLAQVGYNAYGDSTSWKNYQGNAMPTWEQLEDIQREAWVASADAIVRYASI